MSKNCDDFFTNGVFSMFEANVLWKFMLSFLNGG
jgi:hypothetical protein